MSPVGFSLAFSLGVVLETLLVGVFIPLLIIASYAQWKKMSRGRKLNLVMASATVFFGLSTIAHWILGVRRMMMVTLHLPPGITVDQFFLPPYNTDDIVRKALFHSQIVIGDFIMIYRMYHIYNMSLLACIVPLVGAAGSLTIGCGLTYQLRNLKTPADLEASNAWLAACFSVAPLNNAFMSAAIILRLWKVHRETALFYPDMKDPPLLRAIRALVESAVLWTLFASMNFFAFLSKSNLRDTFPDMTSPVIGICFCLIIVRLRTPTPEVHKNSWEGSQRDHVSNILPVSHSRVSEGSASLASVKVERGVCAGEVDCSEMEFRTMSSTSRDEKRSSAH